MFVAALLFVVLPLVEIAVAIQVAHHIGGLNTIGLLILMSIAGFWVAKHVGFSVLRRVRGQVDNGVVPTDALIDTALVFAGGLLLFIPGFVTGALGLLLLIRPIRIAARSGLKHRYQGRIYRLGPRGPAGRGGPDVIDV